ncbi:phosphatidylserine/phosphatidylglycerophosphate/cardiolipin synthase family protein [Myxococcus sp. RHSTA-1-4]|uniref:phospholipase D-like domain-containing protein n=1 Tax=Myxococcus sp. RHSTA-1-4 TaxID=2874601 RepID=UPI001CC034EE|nr:phospholipase D-like domain-containing protein [Myxococcus sp. RHSTA-1-4]MBZ4416329.1 cardiolipin synthase B [Myxococcus sp. RHSTA-1-4]
MDEPQELEELLPQAGAHFLDSDRERARHEMRGPFMLPPGPTGLSFALYQSVGVGLMPGHRLELLENSTVFDRMVEDIRDAKRSVHILVYIWRPSRVSDRIVEALVERARAGVQCRVVVDPVGSEEVRGNKDFDLQVEKVLAEAGVEVHYYRLLAGKVLGRLLGRTHNKIVVVDGRIGYTGGFGIYKTWEGGGLKPEEWRDTSVRVEGPEVLRMQLSFSRHWQESGGGLLPPSAFPEPGEGDTSAPSSVGFVDSAGKLGITDAERMVRLVIAAARERLWIANAYFTPPNAILEQLEEKLGQGVEVRILVPGPIHDVPIIRASQRSTYARLLAAGARIYEYQPSMMHAKTMLVDDWLAVVGSTNLDSLSLNKLGEGSLVIHDEAFVRKLQRCWAKDLRHSKEVTLRNGGRTNPWRRAARRATQLVGRDR